MTRETDAFELEGRAEVILFKLVLADGTIFFMSPKQDWTWRGDFYEEIPCHLSQVKRQADGKLSRPKFTFVNPKEIFSAAVAGGTLENAYLTRHRIMKSDLEADLDLSIKQTMRISRVMSINHEAITTELRGALDGAAFQIPYRTFNPPEFPHVSVR